MYVAHSLPLFLFILDLCLSVQHTNHLLIYLTLSSFFFLTLCLCLSLNSFFYFSPFILLNSFLSLSLTLSLSFSLFSHSSLSLSLSLSLSPSLWISRPDTWQFSNKEEMDPDNSCYVRCSATDHYKGTSLDVSFIILSSFLSIFITCPWPPPNYFFFLLGLLSWKELISCHLDRLDPIHHATTFHLNSI